MDASTSLNFDVNFFKKYATLEYYFSKGAFGNVYGPIQWNCLQLAFKQVLFASGKCKTKEDMEVKREIWTSLKHKHLMRIHSVDLSQLPKVLYIVMEFATGGSLNEALKSLWPDNKLSLDVVTDWAKQITAGMLYLHQRNIVHRDLKSSNILLMEAFDIRNPKKMITLKITDFDEVREHDHTITVSFVGTCAYMAPEVLLKERFSKASDVWSFGVLIWEMLSGDIPHKGLLSSEIILKSLKGEQGCLLIAPSFPEDYKLILKQCWKSTGDERFSFQQIFDVLAPHDKRVDGLENNTTEKRSPYPSGEKRVSLSQRPNKLLLEKEHGNSKTAFQDGTSQKPFNDLRSIFQPDSEPGYNKSSYQDDGLSFDDLRSQFQPDKGPGSSNSAVPERQMSFDDLRSIFKPKPGKAKLATKAPTKKRE